MMNSSLSSVLAVAVLSMSVVFSGCSSTPTKEQDAAPVVDAQQSKPADSGLKQPAQQKPPIDVAAQPVKPAQVEASPITDLSAALKDPNNILSKRIIYFDYDSNLVKEEYRPLVAAHAKYVATNGKARIIIQGNTDERGGSEYNLALGQRRADAVKQMMAVLGADAGRVESVSFGKEKPRAQGMTEEAYAQNRRAEIVYQGE
jgi:peptidoglycan-associated lipoprotein